MGIIKAWRVQPRNYLLFACHITNATAQSIQEARFMNYWHNGGREKKLGITSPGGPSQSDEPGQVIKAVNATPSEADKTAKH